MKKRTLNILILLVILATGLVYALRAYNAGPRDLSEEKTDLRISANELLANFQVDETSANILYLDKVIEVEGVIASVESEGTQNIILETDDILSTVVCEMTDDTDLTGIGPGDQVVVKGQCTGFLSDVILVKCVIKN